MKIKRILISIKPIIKTNIKFVFMFLLLYTCNLGFAFAVESVNSQISGYVNGISTNNILIQSTRQQAYKLFSSSKYESAIQLYRYICSTPYATDQDYYWLGETYFHMGRNEAAYQAFAKVLELNPHADKVWTRLALSCVHTNRDLAKAKCMEGLAVVRDIKVRKDLTAIIAYCQSSEMSEKSQKDNGNTFHGESIK